MRYPMKLEAAPEGGFVVSFPDIPEAITQAETEAEAVQRGLDALESALDFYVEDGRPVPIPSTLKRGQRYVDLPLTVAAKVLLLNEVLAQQVRPSELADRLHLAKQEMTRLLDLRHTSKIDIVAKALGKLGKRLELRLR